MTVQRTGMLALVVFGVLGTIGATGCSRTFRAEAVQPNPIALPTETLRSSERITIVTGDMELSKPEEPDPRERVTVARNRRYPLINQASFTIVSRDRLRFHVQVDHKWEDWADLSTWDVHLEDDEGHVWLPDGVEHARTKLITTMWDREQRTAVCSPAGRDAAGNCITTVGVLDDSYKHRQTLGVLSVFRGNADFVFYQRDIMNPEVRRLRLVVRRTGEAFEFQWRFHDTVARE